VVKWKQQRKVIMTDKSEQFVGGDKFPNYSRKWIEENYKITYTDKQWKILVDYSNSANDEDEYEEDLFYATYNIETLEADHDEYVAVYEGIHGEKPKYLNEEES
jgi:hypothetical protein